MKKTLLFTLLLLASSLGFAQGWSSYSSSIFGRNVISTPLTQKNLMWNEKYSVSLSKPANTNGVYYIEMIDANLSNINTIPIYIDSVFDIAILEDILYFSCEDVTTSITPKGYIGVINLHDLSYGIGTYKLLDIGQNKIHVIRAYRHNSLLHIVGIERNSTTGGYFYVFEQAQNGMNMYKYNYPTLSMQDIDVTYDFVAISARDLGVNNYTTYIGVYDKNNPPQNPIFYEYDFGQYIKLFYSVEPIYIRKTYQKENEVVLIGDGMQDASTPVTLLCCFDLDNMATTLNIQTIYQDEKPANTYDAIFSEENQTLFIVQRNYLSAANHNVSTIQMTDPYDASTYGFQTMGWFDANMFLLLNSIDLIPNSTKFITYGCNTNSYYSRFMFKNYITLPDCASYMQLKTRDLPAINSIGQIPLIQPTPPLFNQITPNNSYFNGIINIDCQQ